MFDFCPKCGSGIIKTAKLTPINDSKKIRTWECLDCGTQWDEFEYEQKQDDSEFITGDLKDGSNILYQRKDNTSTHL